MAASRTISPESEALLSRLHRRPAWFRPLLSDALDLLDSLGHSDEPALAPAIFPFVVSGPTSVREAAARVVGRLLRGLEPADVPWFDDYVRRAEWRWSDRRRSWFGLEPTDLERIVFHRGPALCMATCHWNGYVREAALKRVLSLPPSATCLPFLLIRTNDWVVQVRSTAAGALAVYIDTLEPSDVMKSLALLPWLRQPGLRANTSSAIDALVAPLLRPDSYAVRKAARSSPNVVIRREGYRLTAEADGLTPDQTSCGVNDPDPLLARWVLRHAIEASRDAERERTRQIALGSVHARVRAWAVWDLGSVHPEVVPLEFLFDRAATVRDAARRTVRNTSKSKAIAVANERLQSGSTKSQAATLLGLAELGSHENQVRRLLSERENHWSPRVRAAVLSARMVVDRKAAAPQWILSGLQDSAYRVSRIAYQCGRRLMQFPQAPLWDIAVSGLWRHSRRYALLLLTQQGKWSALKHILHAHALSDPELRQVAQVALLRWLGRFNRSSVLPTDSELRELQAALTRSAEYLSEGQAQRVRFFAGIASNGSSPP